ncbi:MAG: site-specific integrase [Lachnospiraceae bacterium]|nr:site-specific integrase [Lachnospiraceae bacterium]
MEIELSFQGKRKWISTGIRVFPKNWSDKLRVFGLPDAFDSNMKIESMEKTIMNHIRQLMIDGKPFDWSGLNSALENAQMEGSFLRFVENRVLSRKDIKESTRRNHKKIVIALKEFKRLETFNDISRINIIKFDEWLRGRKDYTQSTIASYHRYLKTYIHDAIRQDLIKVDPYIGFRVDQGKPRKRKFLTPEELVRIETCKVATFSLEKVRDMFLFQCYTGLAYSDLKKFDFQLVQQRGNRYVLHDTRKKTNEDFYIVLLPTAINILKKYNYHLPLMTNEQYNMRLKLISESAGLEKNLTSHMGRHTFATMSLNSGIKIEVLAQMMGHADIRTTQIYAKMINCTVEEAYSVLEANEKIKLFVNQLNYFLSVLIALLKCV